MAFPDKLYNRSRDELTAYEDSEFNHMMANVANFYISQTDQTIWGSLLRDVASEVGRLEYFHAYDMIGKNPAYLTPPDAKRQWNEPLFINKNYPTTDQFDLEYKSLVVNLIRAFRLGATVSSIQGVIRAYTGQDIQVEELWKRISEGYYDGTVRNMIRLSVKVGGTSTSSSLISLDTTDVLASSNNISRLKTITDDLYGAIDLAKPAHVGLNLTTIFGLDEHIGEYVWGRYGIIDELRIIAQMIEEEPLPLPLYQAPFLDDSHPNTGLASTEADNVKHKVFSPSLTNPAPPPADPQGYTLEEFVAYQLAATPGTVVDSGTQVPWPPSGSVIANQLPFPGVLSPMLNRVWEIKDEGLDIMDLD